MHRTLSKLLVSLIVIGIASGTQNIQVDKYYKFSPQTTPNEYLKYNGFWFGIESASSSTDDQFQAKSTFKVVQGLDACACLGIIPNFNDGTLYSNGWGTSCSTWNNDGNYFCYVDPQCGGSTPTHEAEWSSQISWKTCSNTIVPDSITIQALPQQGYVGDPFYFHYWTGDGHPEWNKRLVQNTTAIVSPVYSNVNARMSWNIINCVDGQHVKFQNLNNPSYLLRNLNSDGVTSMKSYTDVNDDSATVDSNWLLTECGMSFNPGSGPSVINFEYDSTLSYFDVTSAAISGFTDWKTYFNSPNCFDFESCWLSTQEGWTSKSNCNTGGQDGGPGYQIDGLPKNDCEQYCRNLITDWTQSTCCQWINSNQRCRVINKNAITPRGAAGKRSTMMMQETLNMTSPIYMDNVWRSAKGCFQDATYVTFTSSSQLDCETQCRASVTDWNQEICCQYNPSSNDCGIQKQNGGMRSVTNLEAMKLTENKNFLLYSDYEPSSYSIYFRVTCIDQQPSTVYESRFKVNYLNCYNTLQDPAPQPDIILEYGAGIWNGSMLLQDITSSGGGKWNESFVNSDIVFCHTSCSLFSAGCVNDAPSEFELFDTYLRVRTDSNIDGFSASICIKCSNVHDEVVLDNWNIQVKGCTQTFQAPLITPLRFQLTYDPNGAPVPLYPDSRNLTWKEYFQSSSRCQLQGCQLYEGGNCNSANLANLVPINNVIFIQQPPAQTPGSLAWCPNGIGCQFELGQRCYIIPGGFDWCYDPNINNNEWVLHAKVDQASGYSLKVCVSCTTNNNPNQAAYLDNWEIVLNSCTIDPVHNISAILDLGQSFKVEMSSLFNLSGPASIQECQTLTYSLQSSSEGMSINGSFVDFDSLNPSENENSTILTVVDQVMNTAQVNLTYFVCGMETVLLTNLAPKQYVLAYQLGQGIQTVKLDSYIGFFKSSNQNCPVVSYRLAKLGTFGEALEYTGSLITMRGFTIEINASNQIINESLFLEAFTKNSNKTALLDLKVIVRNFPPYFKDGNPEAQVFEFEEGQELYYQIPDVVDQEDLDQSQIQVVISGLDPDFMDFNDELKQLRFYDLTASREGIYELQVVLIDSFELSASYSLSFEFKFIGSTFQQDESNQNSVFDEMNPPTEQTKGVIFSFEAWVPETELIEDQKLTPLTAKIIELSFVGELEIDFNSPLKDIALEKINSSQIQVDLIVSDERDTLEGFDNQSLDFSFEPIFFNGTRMTLKINFENPDLISPNLDQPDLIKVRFPQNVSDSIFKPQSNKFSSLQTKELQVKVKRQIQKTPSVVSLKSGAEIAQIAVIWCIIISFILNNVLAGAAIYLSQMLRYLQIVVHLQALNVFMPANIMIQNSILMQVANFDALSSEGICSKCEIEQYFDLDRERIDNTSEQIPSEIRSLGYESYNRMDNTGSLSLIFILYALKVSLIGTVFMLLHTSYLGGSKRLKKLLKWLVEGTFYNQILAVSLESYFEFMISGYLHMKYGSDLIDQGATIRTLQDTQSIEQNFDTWYGSITNRFDWDGKVQLQNGEIVGYGFSVVTVTIVVLVLPTLALWIVFQDQESLETIYDGKIGELYSEVKLQSKNQLSYPLIYLVRRISFVYLIIYFNDESQGLQLLLVMLLNLAAMIYVSSNRRLKNRVQHQLDYWNEFCLSMLHSLMVLFTEHSPIEQRVGFGWIFIAVNSCMLAVNLSVVVYQGMKHLFIVAIKVMNIVVAHIENLISRYKETVSDYQTLNRSRPQPQRKSKRNDPKVTHFKEADQRIMQSIVVSQVKTLKSQVNRNNSKSIQKLQVKQQKQIQNDVTNQLAVNNLSVIKEESYINIDSPKFCSSQSENLQSEKEPSFESFNIQNLWPQGESQLESSSEKQSSADSFERAMQAKKLGPREDRISKWLDHSSNQERIRKRLQYCSPISETQQNSSFTDENEHEDQKSRNSGKV